MILKFIIYNTSGQLTSILATEKLDGKIILSVPPPAKGVYFLQMRIEEKLITKKFMY
jgi:hypothetical protein